MATYNFLPGVQVATLDGGLVARTVPTSKAVLIFGTSGAVLQTNHIRFQTRPLLLIYSV